MMTLDRKHAFWRLGASVLLIAAVLLISLGSHNATFHQWIHGDDVACSLAHHSPQNDASEEESPEGQHSHGSDPLEPFCQTGYLEQVAQVEVLLEQPKVVEPFRNPASVFVASTTSSSLPSRAPPVSI